MQKFQRVTEKNIRLFAWFGRKHNSFGIFLMMIIKISETVHLFSYSFFTKDVVIGFVIFENCNDKIQASFTSFISLLKCIHVLNNVPWLQFLLFCTLYCTGRSHKLSSFSGRLNSSFVITAEFAWNIKHNTGNTIK